MKTNSNDPKHLSSMRDSRKIIDKPSHPCVLFPEFQDLHSQLLEPNSQNDQAKTDHQGATLK